MKPINNKINFFLIVLLTIFLFCISCSTHQKVIVSKTKTVSAIKSCHTEHNEFIVKDYSPSKINNYRLYLQEIQNEFDNKYSSSFSKKNFSTLKFYLRVLIELDRQFIGEVDFSRFIHNSIFGLVGYAKVRSNAFIKYSNNILECNENKLLIKWDKKRDLENDISNISNYINSIKLVYHQDLKVTFKNLVGASIYAMFNLLNDPYTKFSPSYSEVDLEKSKVYNTICFPKVGLELIEKNENYVVLSVLYNFSAYNSGIKRRDIIKEINNISIKKLKKGTIKKLLKNTINHIKIERETPNGLKKVNIILPNINYYDYRKSNKNVGFTTLGPRIGYIRLGEFEKCASSYFVSFDNDKHKDLVRRPLLELIDKGVKALILDLRNNPGGRAYIANRIAELFLQHDLTIYETFYKRKPSKKYFSKQIPITTLPLIVLINHNSASSSEVLACALKDNGRAIIIGENSFGKGTGWSFFYNPDRSWYVMIKNTAWVSPSRKSIENIGIAPDIDIDQVRTKDDIFKFLPIFKEKGIKKSLGKDILTKVFKLMETKIKQYEMNIHNRIGFEYLKLKKYRFAEDQFFKVLNINPYDHSALIGIGLICSHFKAFDLALNYLNLADSLKRNDTDVHYFKGLIYFKAGKFKMAEEYFRTTLNLNEFYPGANYFLGNVLRKQGNIKESMVFLKKAHIFENKILNVSY